ncbi:microcin C transport system ATP-binding protein [Formivibrio citricus]|uniref:Microcin C transport system ATP-binding protein n=1 Tax=Formivibrio citricus TaxID=83765 RepID=A0A1I4X8M6_9NEIS|nr:microcin C transport system ATP-binding protein [Formivibrio citricus]
MNGISFAIKAGERLALVGESGSGKSVTARAVLRLDPGARLEGEIRYREENLLALPESRLRALRGNRIAMIFQEPMTALNPLYSIGDQIGEVLQLHRGLTRLQARGQAISLLERVGISDAEKRLQSFPHQLSGGQRQRAMIAMALAGDPELLIADEPTTALDVTLQAQILDLLSGLQRERNMAVLLITHDLNLVRRFADRVAVMQYGRIIETATTSELFAAPREAYTRTLLESRPDRQASPLPDSGIILKARGLAQTWRKRRFLRDEYFTALEPLDLELSRAETLAIVGESGSGKTSLATALLRLAQGSQGEIECAGERFDLLKGASLRKARRHMQIVFQDPFGALSPRQTVGEIVTEGLLVHEATLSNSELRLRAERVMEQVGLPVEVLERYPHEFSGGQRQRIAIARALMLRPDILVLDEPTSALDATVQKQVLVLLADLQKQYGISYLLITHDLALVRAMAHRVMVLKNGRVVESGDVRDVLVSPQSAYTQALLAASGLNSPDIM